MLLWIWNVSLLLAGTALLALGWLLLRRMRVERQAEAATREVADYRAAIASTLEASGGQPLLPAMTPAVALSLERFLRRERGDRRRRIQRLLLQAGVEDVLRRLIQGHEDQAITALYACQYLSLEQRVPLLRVGLGHASHHVRLAAAELLVDCAGEPSTAAILRAVLTHPDHLPTVSAARVIRRIGLRALPYWRHVLDNERSPRGFRVAAVEALAELGIPAAFAPLRRALTAPDPAERAAAWHGMAVQRERRVSSWAGYGLQDQDWRVRAQAALYVGRLRLQEYQPFLERLLGASVWSERYLAADAIVALGSFGIRRLHLISREDSIRGRSALAVLAQHRMRL